MQTKIALGGVSAEELKRVIIAYEPVWAIGTGKTATAQQANEVCHTIREVIADLYGKDAADAFTIQYGGSMNAGNAAELLAQPDVDGGLIGRRFPEAQRLRHHRQGRHRGLSPMNCPVCGKEMEPGFVQTNQRAAWVKKPHALTLMPKGGESCWTTSCSALAPSPAGFAGMQKNRPGLRRQAQP